MFEAVLVVGRRGFKFGRPMQALPELLPVRASRSDGGAAAVDQKSLQPASVGNSSRGRSV